ncbi:hypothetical protein VTO42DRAFT_2968 [Malbranchea cinnamomea]
MATAEGRIYSATYSNVPVYEYKFGSESVMRRRVDDWINATHILKAAGLDKPSRTRILEREVQKGVHEKIQGGYGKYQGTWVPLEDGRDLARKNGILDRLLPIFDYIPGDQSPPPAPKHTNAISARPRAQRLVAASRRPVVAPMADPSSFVSVNSQSGHAAHSFSQDQYSMSQSYDQAYDEEESVAQESVEASSMIGEEELPASQHSTHSRKRKRGMQGSSLSVIEQNHIIYGDQLLDYFMTVGDAPTATRIQPPTPPPNFQVDRAIDDQGNTALHWACAMGDLEIVKDLINRGADIGCLSNHDETPLVRAVLFTNNYEKQTMQELAELLKETISFRDWFGATVFNHLAAATRSKGKWKSSRYYAQVLIEKLREMYPLHEVSLLLSSQDSNGDTAALTAAKNGCYRLATTLLSYCPEAGDLQNKLGETANEVLLQISRQFQEQQAQDNHADPDYPAHPSSDTVTSPSYRRQSHAAELTAALLQRVSSIMEEANRRLARAYGDVKSPRPRQVMYTDDDDEDGNGNPMHVNIDDDPQKVWTRIDSEREALKEQADTLAEKDGTREPLESMIARYEDVRGKYEDVVERIEKIELRKRFAEKESTSAQVNGIATTTTTTTTTDTSTENDVKQEDAEKATQEQTPANGNTRADADADSETKSEAEVDKTAATSLTDTATATASADHAGTTTDSSNDNDHLSHLYTSALTLLSLQQARQQLIRELIQQRADTGASAGMDVHRKLVALATGMSEDEIDPMASGIADTLEFERRINAARNGSVGVGLLGMNLNVGGDGVGVGASDGA